MNTYTKITLAFALVATIASPMSVNAAKKDKSNRLSYIAVGVVGGVAIAAAAYYYRDNLNSGYQACGESASQVYQSLSKETAGYYGRVTTWIGSFFAPKSSTDHFKDGVKQLGEEVKGAVESATKK